MRLLYEFMFIQIERWTSIPKMIKREVFLKKLKHQYHLSQREQCIYGAQSWKERQFLYESIFITMERWTSILKLIIRDVFLRKPKHQYHLSHQGECVYDDQSWKERRLLYESMIIPIERWTSNLKMVIREVFIMKPKHQYHLSQRVECVNYALSRKDRRLLCESMFILIEMRTSILKLVIRETFPMTPRHQYH